MTTDADFLQDILKDGLWHSNAELLRYSLEERGCGLTVHSRISELRGRGLEIEYRRVKGSRAQAHQYRLIRTPGSLEQRLLSKVEKQENGCWQWTGFMHGEGYGGIQMPEGARCAHRVSYELFVGPIPDGLQIDHLCRNKLCVNPEHLEPVTASENKRRDYESRGVCRNGLHPLTPENELILYDGRKTCRPCRNTVVREYRKRRRLVRTGQRESAAGTDGSAALYGPSGPPASRPLEVSSEGPAVSHLGVPPAQLSLEAA